MDRYLSPLRGCIPFLACFPSVETLGYFRASLMGRFVRSTLDSRQFFHAPFVNFVRFVVKKPRPPPTSPISYLPTPAPQAPPPSPSVASGLCPRIKQNDGDGLAREQRLGFDPRDIGINFAYGRGFSRGLALIAGPG